MRIDSGGCVREVGRHDVFGRPLCFTARSGRLVLGGFFGFGWFVDDTRPTSLEPWPVED